MRISKENKSENCYTLRVDVVFSKNEPILLLGGSSSLAECIAKSAQEEGFLVDVTVRKESLSENSRSDLFRSHYILDLKEIHSIIAFLSQVSHIQYSRIICLIGATSIGTVSDDLPDLDSYYQQYTSRLFFLLQTLAGQSLIPNVKSRMVAMSSRASGVKSYDLHYSAVKSALESFASALSQKLQANQSVISVRCGLILGSTMEKEMSLENVRRHMELSKNQLLTSSEAGRLLWKVSNPDYGIENGGCIWIGPEY